MRHGLSTLDNRTSVAARLHHRTLHGRLTLVNTERGMLDTPEQQVAFREYQAGSSRLPALLEGTQT